MAIKSRLAVYGLMAAFHVIQKCLRGFFVGLVILVLRNDCFGGIGAGEFRPVFFQQAGAAENVCPDNFSVDCDYYPYSVVLA